MQSKTGRGSQSGHHSPEIAPCAAHQVRQGGFSHRSRVKTSTFSFSVIRIPWPRHSRRSEVAGLLSLRGHFGYFLSILFLASLHRCPLFWGIFLVKLIGQSAYL
jgi:hypothetical protein